MIDLTELEQAYAQALTARTAEKTEATISAVDVLAERLREARRQARLTEEISGDRSLILIQEEGQ